MTTEKIKITMSERRPLSIDPEQWPVIARVDRHDGVVECQANHEWTIRVREHADGRRLVYGWLRAGNGGVYAGWRGAEGGFLVLAGDEGETVRAIRRIGGIIGDDKMSDECIADLPAEEIVTPSPTVPNNSLAHMLALLVQAVPHVPEPLQSEIRDTLGGR
jgi:hypothetical protein